MGKFTVRVELRQATDEDYEKRVAPVSVVLTGGFAREEAGQPWPSSVRRAHPQPPKCLEAFGGGANLAACHAFIAYA